MIKEELVESKDMIGIYRERDREQQTTDWRKNKIVNYRSLYNQYNFFTVVSTEKRYYYLVTI